MSTSRKPTTRKPNGTRKPTGETPCQEFLDARAFITDFNVLPTDADTDLIALWSMGTWTFSPAAPAMPTTYPYMYVTGAQESGKTHLAATTLRYICRNHEHVVDVTGATLFRMLGDFDKESGEVIPHYPTLALDEIDSKYASGGSNDEQLRGVGNAGYELGATVKRSAGKTTISFPVYCPKLLIGIDNGRLPSTLVSRCIRIDMKQGHPPNELYSWDVQERSADLKQRLSDWAKAHAMILRDYTPDRATVAPDLSPRQWQIVRPLVQLARAAGIEQRIIAALTEVMNRDTHRKAGKAALYASIQRAFDTIENNEDRLTTNQLLAALKEDGVQLPGGYSGRGLEVVLRGEGIAPKPIRMREDHPGVITGRNGKPSLVARGYFRYMFEDAFFEHVGDGDGSEDDE